MVYQEMSIVELNFWTQLHEEQHSCELGLKKKFYPIADTMFETQV